MLPHILVLWPRSQRNSVTLVSWWRHGILPAAHPYAVQRNAMQLRSRLTFVWALGLLRSWVVNYHILRSLLMRPSVKGSKHSLIMNRWGNRRIKNQILHYLLPTKLALPTYDLHLGPRRMLWRWRTIADWKHCTIRNYGSVRRRTVWRV